MRVSKAEYRDGKLVLTTPSLAEAYRLVSDLKPDREYDIKLRTVKRSTNANSYAWALITKLASKLNQSPESIYRHEIAEISGLTEVLTMPTRAVETFRDAFIRNHIGRKVELLEDDGQTSTVLITYGSSDFDTRQMTAFIDALIQDCDVLGIDYDDGNIKSLLESWHG